MKPTVGTCFILAAVDGSLTVINSGSAAFMIRLSLTLIVGKRGPQYAVFNTRFALIRFDAVYTVVATLGVAVISSMVKPGNVDKLFILKLFILTSPVFGREFDISLIGFGSY
jgi:hypothetical protein